MPEHHRSWRRWGLVWTLSGGLVAAVLIALATVVPFRSETARRKVIDVLSARFDAEVELTDLRIRVLPTFRAEGHGLTIRHKGRRDVPPMITVKTFSAQGNLFGVLRRHIARVTVNELDIAIPPDHNKDGDEGDSTEAQDDPGAAGTMARTFVIDELIANDGRFVTIPRDATKAPKIWIIHGLMMNGVGLDRAMPFRATVQNAVPPGAIEATGSFGPWHAEQPGETPLQGTFTFERADLAVFKGISGILSAKGRFGGTLERIDVHGETDTPDFTVESGGHPIPLHATYHAIVDGTNGNTFLEQVDASFLQTALTARGAVEGRPGTRGRTVSLEVIMRKGRIEDVLRMAVKSQTPPMTGALKLATTLEIPPGDIDVVEKLKLDGAFTISDASFTDVDTQSKINDLSHRTRGQAPSRQNERVTSQFAGAFKLRAARLAIPHVTFDTPGAAVRLTGSYGLVSERIDFAGTVFTDAKISEMTTGYKSLLLKPVDLVFNNKAGGSSIPVRISGTRNEPSFGLDKGRVFKQ